MPMHYHNKGTTDIEKSRLNIDLFCLTNRHANDVSCIENFARINLKI